MKTKFHIICINVLMVLALLGCQSAAPAQSNDVAATATQSEVAAATATPAQSEVATATATLSQSDVPVATPTLAANQVIVDSAAQILGIWRGRPGSPGDPPQTFWWFKEDGTYRVAFLVSQFNEGYSVEAGKYSFEGTSLILVAGKGGCIPPPNTGTYEVRLTSNADGTPSRLSVKVLSDDCDPRRNGLQGSLPYIQAQP